jgi:hypothetical protein
LLNTTGDPMTHSPYWNHSDMELLRLVDDARTRSPLINELGIRIERSNGLLSTKVHEKTKCPVCLSLVDADYHEDTDTVTLT